MLLSIIKHHEKQLKNLHWKPCWGSLPLAPCRFPSTQSNWSLHLYSALCAGQCCTCPPHTPSWGHTAGTPTSDSQRKLSGCHRSHQLSLWQGGIGLRQVWMRSGKSTLLYRPGVHDSSGVLPPTLARGNIPWGWKHGAIYCPQKHLLPLNTCPFNRAALTLHFSLFFWWEEVVDSFIPLRRWWTRRSDGGVHLHPQRQTNSDSLSINPRLFEQHLQETLQVWANSPQTWYFSPIMCHARLLVHHVKLF